MCKYDILLAFQEPSLSTYHFFKLHHFLTQISLLFLFKKGGGGGEGDTSHVSPRPRLPPAQYAAQIHTQDAASKEAAGTQGL